jgi:hypothetical protein
LALHIVLRRRAPESPWLVHVQIQSYFILVGLFAYGFGSYTAVFSGVVLLGGTAYSALMFGTRVAAVGGASATSNTWGCGVTYGARCLACRQRHCRGMLVS